MLPILTTQDGSAAKVLRTMSMRQDAPVHNIVLAVISNIIGCKKVYDILLTFEDIWLIFTVMVLAVNQSQL